MKKRKSLEARIVNQFLIVVLPLLSVMIYQAVADAIRAADLQRANHRRESAYAARAKYKTFVNGVADAVDTGTISRSAVAALEESGTRLRDLAGEDAARDLGEFAGRLESVQKAVKSSPTLAAMMPLRETINQLDRKLGELDASYEEAGRSAIVQAIESSHQRKIIVAVATAFALLATVYFIWRMIRQLTEPLNEAEGLANLIAAGEIRRDCTVTSSCDIGNLMASLCTMNNSLCRIIGSVKEAASTVSHASGRLSGNANEVVSAAQRQQTTVSQTRADIEAMNESIHQVSERAAIALEVATKTQEVAQAGSTIMTKSLSATARVVDTVEATAGKMLQLTESVQKIDEFTRVIRAIADQTNLLALNAAIEAARAGEQGRGFSVVADEVRKLAERTASETAEITNMITAVHAQTDEVVMAMGRVKLEVAEGAESSRTTSEILQQIVVSARDSAEQAKLNASGAASQLAAARKAVENTEFIAAITTENTGRIDEMREAAGNLAGTATELQEMIGQFKLG